MSEQIHPWCRDVSRDEAIRAAEDDAANWRRLEVGEVIEEGDEYLDPYGIWKDVTGVTRGKTYDSRTFADHRRRRVPLPDNRDLPSAVHDLRRRVEGLETVADHWRRQCEAAADAENREAAVVSRKGVSADGLRKERVTFVVTHCSKKSIRDLAGRNVLGWLETFGESVRVVEDSTIGSGDVFADVGCGSTGDEIVRLTAERDAALRERDAARAECERLSARVAELEAAAAPAANAGGVSNPGDVSEGGKSNSQGNLDSSQEPVAWTVYVRGAPFFVTWSREDAEREMKLQGDAVSGIRPLFAASQPPRGWLTPEERACIEELLPYTFSGVQAKRLTDLLARSTPPRVKVPRSPAEFNLGAWNLCMARWIAAIREAGGEVE